MNSQPTSLLEIRGLSYAYGDHVAVADASFSLEPGEIFGLLGPNGAGKTTTISCLSGLRSGYTGQISFRGRPFHPEREASDRASLGVVPQELALYEDLSAEENLLYFGKLFGLADQRLQEAVKRALALSGLEDRSRDRVTTFSGGMKRRLNLAIGDLHSPELLILDEPTAGVDPQSRNHLFESLEKLRDDGRTLLYTTHYMEEAERLCRRIAIMDQGKVIAMGTSSELGEIAGVSGANLEEIFLKLTGRRLRDQA